MAEPIKVNELRQKVSELIEKALADIREEQPESAKEERFHVARYLLMEAQEYVEAAFILLDDEKPRASLAASRWVLEASVNLLWAAAESDKVDDHLGWLYEEALRLDILCLEGLAKWFPGEPNHFRAVADACKKERADVISKFEAARVKGLAELHPGDADPLLKSADACKKECVDLVGERKWRLPSLEARLRKALGSDHPDLQNKIYDVLYRICCAAAHPSLAVWRRFKSEPDGATVTQEPPDSAWIAAQMVTASSFYLVSSAYCLIELDNTAFLKTWWEEAHRYLAHAVTGESS